MTTGAEPITLDPAVVLPRLRSRMRQHMAQAAQREADLLDEIASLEAYAAQLQDQLASLTSGEPTGSDAWGDKPGGSQ